MTQSFEDIPSSTTLKDSRLKFLNRDNAARTMNSGTALPVVDDATYADMIGMPVFRTDELINKQLTAYNTGTDTPTWTPIVNGPIGSVDGNIASFDGTAGGKLNDGGKSLPTGDIIGTTATQTLDNKTFSSMGAALGIADGGTGETAKTAAFDGLSPVTTKGDLIVSDGTNNLRFPVGIDGKVLSANSATSSGLEWVDAPVPTATGGGLELQIETADFTMAVGKMHYIDASGTINAKLPATYSVADRFAIVSGASDSVNIVTNETVAAQSLIGKGFVASTPSSSSSITCGTVSKKMSYCEFNVVSGSQFIAYVNYVTVTP